MKKKTLPPQFQKKVEAKEAKSGFADMPEKSGKDAMQDFKSGQKMAAAANKAAKK